MLSRLGDFILARPALRRFSWRAGRWLYALARGEERSNAIGHNGESYVQSRAIAAMSPGEPAVVIDIGANQGDWTESLLNALPAARRNKSMLRVEAFEPVPTTAETLRGRVARMDTVGLVSINRVAISDDVGAARMAVMSETGGTNSLNFDDALSREALGFVDVEKTTLARFCDARGIDRIILAKCDTEGHDLLVLRGARDLLAAGRIDVFQFEYNHRWIIARAFLKDVFEMIDGLPYSVARIEPDHIEVFPEWHPELDRFFQSNYLLVRKPALAWFDVKECRFDLSNTYA